MAKEKPKNDDLSLLVRQQVPKLSNQEARQVVGIISRRISITSTSGPYPSPADYEKYHEIDPELTRQMKDMVLKEQAHQHDLDYKYMENDLKIRLKGQWFAFAVYILVVGLGAYTIFRGFEWGGVVITSLGVVAIVAQFLKRR